VGADASGHHDVPALQVALVADAAHEPAGHASRDDAGTQEEEAMRGSIVRRNKTSYSLVISLGRVLDPKTGLLKRRQKWHTYTPPPGTLARKARELAQQKLTDLLRQFDTGTYVETSTMTLIAYLRGWLTKSVKPTRRPETHRVYETFVEGHVAPARLGQLLLQKVRKSDLEHFYNVDLAELSPSSVRVCHAVLSKALKDAVEDGLLQFNPAPLAKNRQTPTAALGQSCPSLAGARFRQVIKASGGRPIKFHGLRHSCATLSLQAGVPVHVVKDRLGHADATMTLNVYGHVLPSMQQDAAAKLGALLANG
jgi:integrase